MKNVLNVLSLRVLSIKEDEKMCYREIDHTEKNPGYIPYCHYGAKMMERVQYVL